MMNSKPEAAWVEELEEDTNINLLIGGNINLLSPIFIYN